MNIQLVDTEKVLHLLNAQRNLYIEHQVMSQLTDVLLSHSSHAKSIPEISYYLKRLQDHKSALQDIEKRLADITREISVVLP